MPQQLIACCLAELPVIDAVLAKLVLGPVSQELTGPLLHSVHLIKQQALGSACEDMLGFAHVLESVLFRLVAQELLCDAQLLDILMSCAAHLRCIVSCLQLEQELDMEQRVNGEELVIKLILLYLGDDYLS